MALSLLLLLALFFGPQETGPPTHSHERATIGSAPKRTTNRSPGKGVNRKKDVRLYLHRHRRCMEAVRFDMIPFAS
uniref:Putative secreted peptide n=1 Tax=Anopheles braziliensis TaxID=58242 RepID=A0A2M3ZSF5_9DIPT